MKNQDRQPGGTTTDFGFERVAIADKAKLVADVFNGVATRYDVMNDVLSLGSHRLLKRMVLEMSAIRAGQKVLDLACGSGDIAVLLAEKTGPLGEILLVDINPVMLALGRDRMLNAGLAQARYIVADGECLPLVSDAIDLTVMAFGLRNVTGKEKALLEVFRVLRPGGRFLILDFSRPPNALLHKAFSLYTEFWPLLGRVIANNADAYRYLKESVHMHPPADALALMVADAGFKEVRYHRLLGGIIAIHIGFKPYIVDLKNT